MQKEHYFQIGKIIKPHGLKGDMRVFLDTTNAFDKNMESCFIEINKDMVPFFIVFMQVQSSKALIHLKGVESIEKAQKMKGKIIYARAKDILKSSKKKFHYQAIVGFQVVDKLKGKLGKVVNVYPSTGQDVMAMKYESKEVLIPITEEIIPFIDLEQKIINTELPDGLLELYLE